MHNSVLQWRVWLVGLSIMTLVGACSFPTPTLPPPAPLPTTAASMADMPNPASAYCVQQGGKLDIRKDTQGAEYGVCVFADQSECEEWALFRGECKPGQGQVLADMPDPSAAFCVQQGGQLEIRKDAHGNEAGVCVFADNSECDAWAFFRGECKPGSPTPAPIDMPNPAAVFCARQGGQSEIRQDASGGEYGVCVFADNSECEEWALFRGECQPGEHPAPTPTPQRIHFSPGSTSASVSGKLAAGGSDRWVLAAQARQVMSVRLDPADGQAILIIWGVDGTVLISDHADATSWSGPLPQTQDYLISVRNITQQALDYTLQVTIPPLPAPTPAPQPSVKRIVFAAGATTAAERGAVSPGKFNRYVVRVMARQTMSVRVAPAIPGAGPCALAIWGADGTVLISDHADASSWSGPIPSTQDYYIDVRGGPNSSAYLLQITIPPLARPTAIPQPAAKRIRFGAGQTSASQKGQLAPGASAYYVLRVMAGQVMSVDVLPDGVSAGQPVLTIWGADGTVLISDHAGAESWSGPVPSNQDYYIGVRNDGAGIAPYVLQITIPPR